MSWQIQFSELARRVALDEGIRWRTGPSAEPDLFTSELERALELISAMPLSYERARSRRFKNARRAVMQKTGFLILYEVQSKRKIIRILDIIHGRAATQRP